MVATAYIVNQIIFCTLVLVALTYSILQALSGRCPLPAQHPSQQTRKGRLHNQFAVLSAPMLAIFMVLCIDPFTANGILTPSIINLLYFNQ